MLMWIRLAVGVVVACAGVGVNASTAHAVYPEKPVTLIVPYPAGGAADLIARNLSDGARGKLAQPLVVVNRPGGAGTVAASEVVRARPDGYTVGLMAGSIMTLQPHRVALAYKGPDDYTPIVEVVNVPVVWAVRADTPWKTFKDMLEDAKKSPGKIRVGGPGLGGTVHLAVEIVKDKSGTSLTYVPFAGNAESVPALLGGHVEVIILQPSDVIPHMRAGKVRFLGTTDGKRSPLYPDVPTFKEIGFPEAGFGVYYFVIAPKGTPAGAVQTLHDAVKQVLESEPFQKFAQETSSAIEYRGPADLKRQLEADYAFFGTMLDKLKLPK